MVLRQRMLRLQQQQLAALKVDRVYGDRLSDAISEELWTKESGELQEQLMRVRAEMERHDGASQAYESRSTSARMGAKLKSGSPVWTTFATGSSIPWP